MKTYDSSTWTHHHTHRLFHLSMSVCFGFISLMIVSGMVTVWFHANAGTLAEERTVGVTALVGGINPGPIDTGGGGGGSPVNPPQPTQQPTVTISPEPRGQIAERSIIINGQNVSSDVFQSSYPAYSGTSNIPNAIIFISGTGSSSFNSTARTDDQGNWYWLSPLPLVNGTYRITATLYNPSNSAYFASASRYFVIENSTENPNQPGSQIPGSAGQSNNNGGSGNGISGGSPIGRPSNAQPFGIYVKVDEGTKHILAGNKVVAEILVADNSGKQISNLVIQYRISDSSGVVVMESSDNITFSGFANFIKTFYTSVGTKPGNYNILVQSTYRDVTTSSSDTFIILSPTLITGASSIVSEGSVVILWWVMVLLLLLFILLVVIAYRHVVFYTRAINDFKH